MLDRLAPMSIETTAGLTARSKGLCVLLAVVAGWFWIGWLPLPLKQAQLYVGPQGSDVRLFSSAKHPLRTIQAAVSRAKPGVVIHLLPGVYREQVWLGRGGAAESPITLRAMAPGTATISAFTEPELVRQLAWRQTGSNVHETSTPWPVRLVRVNGEYLLPVAARSNLFKYTARPGAWGAFHATATNLTVVLRNGHDFATAVIEINRPLHRATANGHNRAANVLVERSNLRFEGITFEAGGRAGVMLRAATNVVFNECLFTGSQNGIAQDGPVAHIMVTNCAYITYPAGQWHRGWLSWSEIYHENQVSPGGLASLRGNGLRIARNLVLEAGDGLQVSTWDEPAPDGVFIHDNLIAHCHDDAFELDGFARNVVISHNLIYDTFESQGLSPVLKGPVLVTNNLFLHPFDGHNGDQFKLLTPWIHRGLPMGSPIQNILVANNTFVGEWLCWWATNMPVREVTVQQNLMAVRKQMNPPWPPGVTTISNQLFALPPEDPYPDPGKGLDWLMARAQDTTAGAHMPWRMRRPGPSWLSWTSHPATANLLKDLSADWFEDPKQTPRRE